MTFFFRSVCTVLTKSENSAKYLHKAIDSVQVIRVRYCAANCPL